MVGHNYRLAYQRWGLTVKLSELCSSVFIFYAISKVDKHKNHYPPYRRCLALDTPPLRGIVVKYRFS